MTPKSRDRLSSINNQDRPLIVVLSGLSGAGKDTVLDGLRASGLPVFVSVSATTRSPRPGEKEGHDYYFVSREQFKEMITSGGMLEWAEVYGNYYGRPADPVRKALREGKDVIIRIDVQGAETIKKKIPQAVLIFLCTITLEELEKRLRKRKTDSEEQIKLRLKTAEKELEQLDVFDYIVFNREDEIDKTVADVKAIIAAEKCRVSPRSIDF